MNELNTHPNESDPKIVHVRDYTVNDNLKKLIDTTYTNKKHLLFNGPSLKNFIV